MKAITLKTAGGPWFFVEAALLYAAFEIGSGWVGRHATPLLHQISLGWFLSECAQLLLAGCAVLLFKMASPHRSGHPERAKGWAAAESAFQTFLLLGLLALVIRLFDPGLDEREFAARGLGSPRTFWRFLATLPVAVAAEEVIFRAAQNRLRLALGPCPGALAVALAFALYHLAYPLRLPPGSTTTLLAIAVGGWLLARLYEATGSLALLVLVHAAYDNLAVSQGWLNVQQRRIAEAALFTVWLLGAALVTFGLRALRRQGWSLRPAPVLRLFRGRAAPAEAPSHAVSVTVADLAPRLIRATPVRAIWIAAGTLLYGCLLAPLLKWVRTFL